MGDAMKKKISDYPYSQPANGGGVYVSEDGVHWSRFEEHGVFVLGGQVSSDGLDWTRVCEDKRSANALR